MFDSEHVLQSDTHMLVRTPEMCANSRPEYTKIATGVLAALNTRSSVWNTFVHVY